jgi:hypothetical protein
MVCQHKERFKTKNIKAALTLAIAVLKHVNIVLHVTYKNKM